MNNFNPLRRPFRYAYVNAALILIGINLLVYLLNNMRPITVGYMAMNPVLVLEHSMFWQVFTYQFVHANFTHLLFNMLAIFFFGTAVERRLGSSEFLLLYLLSGTLSGIASLLFYLATGALSVFLMGASGAVFALLLAYAVLFPRSLIYIWGILPVPAPILVIGYTALEIYNMLTGRNMGVSHLTHLAGFVVCWLYCQIRLGVNPWKIMFPKR